MTANTRVTVTISSDTASDLSSVSSLLGITRSALIAELLAMASSDLRAASLKIPLRASVLSEPALRLRGQSASVIQGRIRELWSVLNGD